MINTQDIRKIVKLVLLSAYLKNTKPLNLLIVGKAGVGKTENITYHKGKRFEFLTDTSYMGLFDLLKENTEIKHIIIPDFLKITMKRRSTSDNLTSFLNAGIEEGLGRVKNYNLDYDFKGRHFGLITATTKASYTKNISNWKAMGFVSRMIVCSYDYKQETIDEILNYINEEKYLLEKDFEKLTGYRDVEVKSTKELNSQMNSSAQNQFRTLKQLQTLLKCNAILNQRKEVIQEDVEEIKRLSKYLNMKFTKI